MFAFKVKLTYFKSSGKYYTDGEYETKETELYLIYREVRELKRMGKLPGLAEGHSDFFVLAEVPDYPQAYPHLAI